MKFLALSAYLFVCLYFFFYLENSIEKTISTLNPSSNNISIYLEYFGCNLGVGTIDGKCFRLDISENSQKRRYRVDFEPTG